jgi:hypothetical protein
MPQHNMPFSLQGDQLTLQPASPLPQL